MPLFESDNKETYNAGEEYEWNFKCDDIQIEGVKEKYLLNTGLLTLEGAEGGNFDKTTLVKINMMVHVSKDQDTGNLYKHIISETED